MKMIKGWAVGFVLLVVMMMGVQVQAQEVPPIVVTNVVRIEKQPVMKWDARADAVGYYARMWQGTGATEWKSYTTNTQMKLITLNSNLVSGEYFFAVSAVNKYGDEGPVTPTLRTNVAKLPGVVVNLRVEVELQ